MYGAEQNIPHPDAVATMIRHGSLQKPELTIDEIGRNIFFPQNILGEGEIIKGLQESIHRLYYAVIAFR